MHKAIISSSFFPCTHINNWKYFLRFWCENRILTESSKIESLFFSSALNMKLALRGRNEISGFDYARFSFVNSYNQRNRCKKNCSIVTICTGFRKNPILTPIPLELLPIIFACGVFYWIFTTSLPHHCLRRFSLSWLSLPACHSLYVTSTRALFLSQSLAFSLSLRYPSRSNLLILLSLILYRLFLLVFNLKIAYLSESLRDIFCTIDISHFVISTQCQRLFETHLTINLCSATFKWGKSLKLCHETTPALTKANS